MRPAALLVLACLVPIPGAAQQEAPTAQRLPVLPPRVGVNAAPPVSLTLGDVVRMTLEGNNDVSLARLEVDSAREDIRVAAGVFDPRLVPSLSYQRVASASASAIGGATNGRIDQDLFAGAFTVEGRTPWAGGRFAVDFTSSRIETSNQFARLNPQFPSALAASYVQPLGRGRGTDLERRQIRLARRAVDLTDAQLVQVVIEQLTLVEQAYWDLVFAVRNLDVQASALTQAQSQVESNERQVRQGTLAPIDVVEAQIQVANFRQSVASAQQTLTEAENRLKRLMLATREAPAWNQPLVPAEPTDRPLPALALDDAVRLALERRPELAAVESVRAQNEIDREFFRDQAKPQVDLVAGYTLSGLAGGSLQSASNPLGGSASEAAMLARLNDLSLQAGLDPLPAPPPTTGSSVPEFLVGGYNSSLGNLFGARFPTAVVQVQMSLPLGNTTARANMARADIARVQITRQRQQLELAIEAEVRNALQAVESSQQRLDAAASAQRNALEQYESERRRFDSGLSTVFLVLERQNAFVSAQARELRARADLNQAVAALERATGGTLQRHGVTISDSVMGIR